MIHRFTIFSLISCLLVSCTYGQLQIVCTTPSYLEEISAIEYDALREVFWVIQDSGNSNEVLAIDSNGAVKHRIQLKGVKNQDWEDLTRDTKGNLYVGDFGNNKKSRNSYKIYKIKHLELEQEIVIPVEISFELPRKSKEKNFEGFFELEGHFYLFSKAHDHTDLFKIPNKVGWHIAEKLTSYKFKGKHNKVTSAALSPDKTTVVLLNDRKLWKLSDFETDHFFSGTIETLEFKHKSQKEGIGFLNDREVVISDERNDNEGGHIYQFKLD